MCEPTSIHANQHLSGSTDIETKRKTHRLHLGEVLKIQGSGVRKKWSTQTSGTIFFGEIGNPSKNTITRHRSVSKNNGTPKWVIYNGKPYFLMDDLGGKPTIFGNTQIKWKFPQNFFSVAWPWPRGSFPLGKNMLHTNNLYNLYNIYSHP